MPLILLVSLAATAATAASQTPLVLPAEYDRAWGRESRSVLGNDSTRTQMVFANPFPIGTPVFGIGLRPAASTLDRAQFTADVEIQMSSSPAVPGALNSTFASNVGSDVVVALPQQIVTIPAMAANRSTGQFAQFLFPTPFVFGLNGDTNLVVEVFVHSRSAGAVWMTDRAFASNEGRAATLGIGCGAGAISSISSTSAGGTYVAGSTLTLSLQNAPANTLGLLLYSFDMKEAAPGLLLPIPLSLIGSAVGCDLLLNPAEGVNVFAADAAGTASGAFTVPLSLSRFGLGWQWGYFVTPTPANAFGIEVTRERHTWIGPEVVTPDAQYVWDLSSVSAVTGNATTNSVPVVQFLLP